MAYDMQEMISRIIEMDKKAQEITRAAEREKVDSEKAVAEKAAQIREEYLSSARRRIQINKELEHSLQEQQWAKTKARYDVQIEKMKQLYKENGDQWVETIFRHVTEG